MNDRVKEVRNALGLSMESFGSRIGITRSAISRIESGIVGVTNQNVTAICREFNVREDWLKTGSGEMFLEQDDTAFGKFCEEYNLDSVGAAMIKVFASLPKDQRDVVYSLIHAMSDAGHHAEHDALGRMIRDSLMQSEVVQPDEESEKHA